MPEEFKKEPMIEKAFHALDAMYLNAEDRAVYDARIKDYRDTFSKIEGARLEGIEEGKLEERKSIVQAMNRKGMEPALIASILGISEEDVEQFKV